ncbi:hypothetical protein [Qipengyuania sp. JC766]|uniref:hypothetical protein n=1 Tax=Qipengyuania sp. JC766 TaxID=3232139 RepID=UPI0034595CD9
MLGPFFEEGDWFRPKTFGYGAGLPIAWQGWVLLASYVAFIFGLSLLAAIEGPIEAILLVVLGLPVTILFLIVVHRRTRGGWRWRAGGDD